MPSDGPGSMMDLVIVGNPGSRRVGALTTAAVHVGGFRVQVIPYTASFEAHLPVGCLGRLESPGECTTTARHLLSQGIEPMHALGKTPMMPDQLDQVSFERGEIIRPLQWFLGFQRVLASLAEAGNRAGIAWMTTPRAVAAAFDKLHCLRLWEGAGLPTPRRFPGVTSYDDIRRAVPDRNARLFVKLRYGYSAMGAVAIEWRGGLIRAITTVEVVETAAGTKLYLTRQPRVIRTEAEIARLIDLLAAEDILVEEWLSKAVWKGLTFDLRVVTIGGRVRHVVGRANGSPFTNLNLGARRIPRDEVVELLGQGWAEAERICLEAAAVLPDAMVLGIDLLVRPGFGRFAVLEANAFGDYLPGLLHEGESTYEAVFRHARASA